MTTMITSARRGLTAPDSSRRGTFVALGDSLTSGIGVGLHTPSERTWPMLLGTLLPGVDVRRLAVSGATTADVRYKQLPDALALRPVLASVLVGLNDVLRTRCAEADLAENLAGTLATLRYAGTRVLTATMHDPTLQLRLPGPWKRRLQARRETLNDVIRAAASTDPGIAVIDLAGESRLATRSAWAPDRVHLSEYGHEVVASAAAKALALRPLVTAMPPTPASNLRHLRWLATSGAYWLVTGGAKRSLPFLVDPRG
jgi:lysophospholipase L1-like esterase